MTRPEERLIVPFAHVVSVERRQERFGHTGGVFWLTGLSGAGKSTIAMSVESSLLEQGVRCMVLDGDNIRHGLNSDLGFSPEDRKENIRRVAEVSALIARSGIICVAAFISPSQSHREMAREIIGSNFYEIYINANIEACEARDPKGLYKKARSGLIKEFTGISSPYEEPTAPDLVIDTQHNDVQASATSMLAYITSRSAVPLRIGSASNTAEP